MFNPDSLLPKIKYWRGAVMDAFDAQSGYYYHTSNKSCDNFIDMLAWVGWMACGCKYVEDYELMDKCVRCVDTVLTVGENARTFAPYRVTESWKPSQTIPGLWYKEKAQSFAGPSAWYRMKKLGIEVKDPLGSPFTMKSVESDARWIAMGAGALGTFSRWFSGLRQHIDSTWLALEVLGRKAPHSLDWTKFQNPFFMAINGEPFVDIDVMPQMLISWDQDTSEDTDEVQPLCYTGASDWVWRRDPYKKHTHPDTAKPECLYTPTALLTAAYFQMGRTLR